jgi:hypothetical protein
MKAKQKKEIIIWKENFSIIKAKKPVNGAFANIIDKNETTVIIPENKMDKKNIIKIDSGYKLLTFNMILQFNLVGFIAKISKALAEEKIPIFVISAYSTDHILIKKEHLEKAIKALTKLGFDVVDKI